jgi:putative protease
MKNDSKNLELLAPAGNLEKLKTALLFGADAVYAGIPDFSLRVRINDFDFEKLKEATEYCHLLKKKIYVTVNIFAHNDHIARVEDYINKLKEIKVDALIVSDPGIILSIQKKWPEAEIHLSTQANCTNWQAAKFWFDLGVKRIILGREVALTEIKLIKDNNPDLELEYFVHGAMCMAYSGRCFLSKEMVGRSGNLGDCVQPCRWSYDYTRKKRIVDEFNELYIQAENHSEEFELVKEQHGSYLLNSKDLCLIKYIKDLAEAGVSSFKIEGRAKSVYYQAVVNGIYSRVTHNAYRITHKEIDYYYQELNTKLVHRGYTTGFLLGSKGEQNIEDSHLKSDWEFCGVVADAVENSGQKTNNSFIQVKVHNSLKVGDKIEIIVPEYDIIKMKVQSLVDPENGQELKEAHGGQERQVLMCVSRKALKNVPAGSVLRRIIS